MAICFSNLGGVVFALVGTKPSSASPRAPISRAAMVMTIPRMKLRISDPRKDQMGKDTLSKDPVNQARIEKDRLEKRSAYGRVDFPHTSTPTLHSTQH